MKLDHLWRLFLDVHAGRTVNGFAPNKASHLDLWAYQQNRRVRLDLWEIEAVDRLGNCWIRVHNDAAEKARAAEAAKTKRR